MSTNKHSIPLDSISCWKTVKFSSLCDITRGASPRPINDWISTVGVPWVKISDATATNGATTINSTREHIKPEARHKSVEVFPGDLILSNSATPGIPKFLGIHACIHDGWLLLRNFRGIEKQFAYYLLLHERQNLIDQGNGSVFTNLKTDILKNHQILLPPLPEQRRIAHVLGTLDDKIENNRKTAKTLEAMAQAIFKSWFVDFDPVRAKMAGESRESICKRLKLTPEILDLFPDRLVDSELGEIPEGWRVGRVLDFGDIICGKTPPKKNPEFFGKGIPFIKIPDMHDWVYVISPSEQLTALGEATQANKTIPAGTICVSCIATVGEVVLTHERSQTNQQINSIVPKHEETTVYLYFQMIEKKGLFTDLASAGSTTLNMNTSTFSKINILVPKINILKAFSSVITTLFKGILMTQKEIKTISGIRDALLPKLISGEARVPDADHLHKRL